MTFVLQLIFGWTVTFGASEPSVHWTASYVDGAGTHVVEAWRQPGHVRHVTDRVIELDASRPKVGAYRFTINDRRRGLTFHGDEHDRIMQRSFDDWERWTHVVARPSSDTLVLPLDRAAGVTPAGRCTWFTDGTRELCWSRDLGLPLVIRVAGSEVYTVTSSSRFRGAMPPFAPVGAEVGRDDD